MRTASLAQHLQRTELRRALTGKAANEALIGVGRDPRDGRRTCILVYLPPEADFTPPEFVTLGGERVRVVTRTRGGPLRAHSG